MASASASPSEAMPRAPLLLGLSGTIPFFATAGIAASAADAATVATACHGCVAYGCSILSFLGAVHWGVALRSTASKARTWDFVYSVCPSLAAAAAATLPDQSALLCLFPSFGAALVYDAARFAGDKSIPSWYPRLRRPLTLAAMTSTGVCLGVLVGGTGQLAADEPPARDQDAARE